MGLPNSHADLLPKEYSNQASERCQQSFVFSVTTPFEAAPASERGFANPAREESWYRLVVGRPLFWEEIGQTLFFEQNLKSIKERHRYSHEQQRWQILAKDAKRKHHQE